MGDAFARDCTPVWCNAAVVLALGGSRRPTCWAPQMWRQVLAKVCLPCSAVYV